MQRETEPNQSSPILEINLCRSQGARRAVS
jgi:hypothetical protein